MPRPKGSKNKKTLEFEANIGDYIAEKLLENEGQKAREIIAGYKPVYPSIAAYFEAMDKLILDKDAVIYNEDGSVTIDL